MIRHKDNLSESCQNIDISRKNFFCTLRNVYIENLCEDIILWNTSGGIIKTKRKYKEQEESFLHSVFRF